MKSLDRALYILEYLSHRKGAGVTEVATEFDIDKSTASRILATFVRHDIVYKDADTGKYRLSVGPLLFSYRTMSYHEIMSIAHPILVELAARTGETAHLCVLQQDRIYVLAQVKGKRNKHMKDPTLPGMREPLHCTAVGKVILAYMPPNEARRLLSGTTLDSYTEKTISDVNTLLTQFETIRREGYAIDDEELAKGVVCAAVPVYDEHGFVTHSIGISGNDGRMLVPEIRAQLVSILKQSGARLTEEYNKSKRL